MQRVEAIPVAFKAAHRQSREMYGPRRMQPDLAAQGFAAGRERIARLRRELALVRVLVSPHGRSSLCA
jgi:hypothetical protein